MTIFVNRGMFVVLVRRDEIAEEISCRRIFVVARPVFLYVRMRCVNSSVDDCDPDALLLIWIDSVWKDLLSKMFELREPLSPLRCDISARLLAEITHQYLRYLRRLSLPVGCIRSHIKRYTRRRSFFCTPSAMALHPPACSSFSQF